MMLFINRNCCNFTANTCSLSECFFFFQKKRLLAPPVVLQNLARGQWSVRNKGNLLFTVRDNIFLSYKPLILFKGVDRLKR